MRPGRLGPKAGKKAPSASKRRIQVNVRVEPAFFEALRAVARQDRRSVPQAALRLMEAGLRHRTQGPVPLDDPRAHDIARLASGGGAFGWLAEEPDLYGNDSGEPA